MASVINTPKTSRLESVVKQGAAGGDPMDVLYIIENNFRAIWKRLNDIENRLNSLKA
jgi:hypothetical protein